MIYKQKISWPCGNYAYLVALNKLWVNITEEEILKLGNFLTSTRALNYLHTLYPKIDLKRMATPKLIDLELSRGWYVVTWSGNMDFNIVRNPPYINSLQWTKSHFFLIVENLWDKWKIQDSQWDKFADGGYWYLPKTLFKKLITPSRIIINGNKI